MAFLLACVFCHVQGQTASTDKQLLKQARKEAKSMERAGWKAAIGMPGLTEQVLNSFKLRNETDSLGQRRYRCATSMAKADNVTTALAMAEEEAKYDLTNNMKVKVISNTSLSQTATQSATSIQNETHTHQALRNTIRVFAIYRQLGQNSFEAQVCLALKIEDINR